MAWRGDRHESFRRVLNTLSAWVILIPFSVTGVRPGAGASTPPAGPPILLSGQNDVRFSSSRDAGVRRHALGLGRGIEQLHDVRADHDPLGFGWPVHAGLCSGETAEFAPENSAPLASRACSQDAYLAAAQAVCDQLRDARQHGLGQDQFATHKFPLMKRGLPQAVRQKYRSRGYSVRGLWKSRLFRMTGNSVLTCFSVGRTRRTPQ